MIINNALNEIAKQEKGEEDEEAGIGDQEAKYEAKPAQ